MYLLVVFFFKQKTAYEMRISDWSSDVCSSDLVVAFGKVAHYQHTGTYGFDYYANDTFHDHKGIPAAAEWLKARKDKRPLALFVGSNWPHVPWPRTTEGYDPAAMKLPPKTVDTPIPRDARARFYAAVTRMAPDPASPLDAVDAGRGKDGA